MKRKTVCITALLTAVIIAATAAVSLFAAEKRHRENVVNVYRTCCREAQEALYTYQETEDDSHYRQLCDNICAMTNIALVLKKDDVLRQANNELLKSYAYLAGSAEESAQYLDFLNEALIAYAKGDNVELFQVKLLAFNNRVGQGIKN